MRRLEVKNLEFKESEPGLKVARFTFPNGYTAIVRTGKKSVHTYGAPYDIECVPMNQNISDGLIGYCSEEQINEILYEIQHLSNLTSRKISSNSGCDRFLQSPGFDW